MFEKKDHANMPMDDAVDRADKTVCRLRDLLAIQALRLFLRSMVELVAVTGFGFGFEWLRFSDSDSMEIFRVLDLMSLNADQVMRKK